MNNITTNMLVELIDSSKFQIFINKSASLSYPLNHHNILNKLQTEKNASSVTEYFLTTDYKIERAFYESLKQTISNYSLNPNKPYAPCDFYVENSVKQKIHDWLFPLCENKKTMQQIGERGCGKTITQNMFLLNFGKELEKNKVYWVRCDIHKVYQLWLQATTEYKMEPKTINIEEYLDIQLVYVFCKYLRANKFFEDIYNAIEKSELNKTFQKISGRNVYPDDSSTVPYSSLTEQLKIFEKNIKDREINYGYNKRFSYAVDVIMRDSQESSKAKAKLNWLRVSHSLQTFLYNNNYYVLFIVDGADNIKLLNSSSYSLYRKALKQLSRFVLETPKNSRQIRYVSIRESNLPHLALSESTDTPDYVKNHNIIRIRHQENIIEEIFNARIEFVKKLHKDIPNNVFATQHILGKIIDALVLNQKDLGLASNSFYQNNIRCYLFNLIGLAEIVFYRYLQLGKPNNFDIKRQIHNLFNRNLLLSGKLFLRSNIDRQNVDQGEVFSNIFYHSPTTSEEDGKYICLRKIRVLQLLYHQKNSPHFYTESNIVGILHYYFDYNLQTIVDDINKLSESGLIEGTLDNTFDFDSNVNPDSYLYYKLTSKGLYFIENILSDIDVLYIIALDTCLPVSFIDDALVDSFNNELNNISHYRSNCIKTVISFVSFIMHSDRIENEKYKRLFDNEKIRQGDYKKHLNADTFTLSKNINMGMIQKKIGDYLDEIKSGADKKK